MHAGDYFCFFILLDVDECKTPEKNTCQGMLKCVNTRGGYKCAINKIYIIIIGTQVPDLFLLTCSFSAL